VLPTPETQLAYLGFQRLAPSAGLRPYIRPYWYFQRPTPLLAYKEEYMHPTGGFGLVFNLGDAVRLDGRLITAPVFLDGANTVSRQLGFWGKVDLMGIRFYEGGAYPFLGLPLRELQNEVAVLDALHPAHLLELQERLGEAASLPVRIELLEKWLLGRLSLSPERHALIPASLELLRQTNGRGSIPDLAQQLAISQRQLERLYQTQVGMSPKQYTQLLRVEAARLALKQLQGQTTTTLAAELGYYDQAHFIHEFGAVIGLTPTAYRKRIR
jgi:AraC-like DNA-binding protein